MRFGGRPIRKVLGSFYVLIPLVIAAAAALAYYSYRYADEMERQTEQSIIDSTADTCDLTIEWVEKVITDSEDKLIKNVPLDNLQLLRERANILQEQTIKSVIVLDSSMRIVPDGFVSGWKDVTPFRTLFEREILQDLRVKLPSIPPDELFHLHKKYEGHYYLFAYVRRDWNGKTFYIVLENDRYFLQYDVLPRAFAPLQKRTTDKSRFQIVDGAGEFQWGFTHLVAGSKYEVVQRFPTTLTAWRVRMVPLDAHMLLEREETRRRSAVLLIGVLAVMLFGGLSVMLVAVRTERRANEMKSEFIANVSHELKTPLSLIRMFGEMLATGRTKSADQAREYAGIITRESERLSRLIDNVLDFARIERGRVAYEFRVGDLAEVLSRGIDVYRWRLDRDGMKLKVEIEPDLPPVKLDENAMTLVLLNLVDNAVKYAAEGKELAVSVVRREDRVLLVVADKGPGIHADEHARVFERFYRSRSVRGRQVRGSGIGLSLVKHIAEAHGGGVTVESELGKGSAFSVWLPALPEDAEAREETPAAPAGMKS